MDEFRPQSYQQEMFEISLRKNIIVVVLCYLTEKGTTACIKANSEPDGYGKQEDSYVRAMGPEITRGK